MATLGMNGPYNLNIQTIEENVTHISAGNYALGNINNNGEFLVSYVGRSDSDIRFRLKSWVGKTKWAFFKYCYATSPKAAFEKECINYHDFNPPENDVHPDRPNGTNWQCPKCDIFD